MSISRCVLPKPRIARFNSMSQPEHLNLWDRVFNRYRRIIHDRGEEGWVLRSSAGFLLPDEYRRDWVEYKVIDRLTGSEHIEREYIN